MWQELDSDVIGALKDKEAMFSFWFYPETVAEDGSQNNARAEIYYEYDGSSDTINGVWIAPTELKWWNAYVTASIPTTTTAIKVIIHGTPDFKAWVDVATISIYTSEKRSVEQGNLSVSANLYSSQSTYLGPEQPDWIVGVSAGLYAEGKGDYRIMAIKLKVNLVPNDQHGELSISYCGQTNNKDYDVDPAACEEFQNTVVDVAEIAIQTIADGAIAIVAGPEAAFFAAAVVAGITGAFMEHFRSNTDDAYANTHLYPGDDYFVLERWDYPIGMHPKAYFVRSASGHYGFKWLFYADTATSFQIEITASVYWGELKFSPSYGMYHLANAGVTIVRTNVIINA